MPRSTGLFEHADGVGRVDQSDDTGIEGGMLPSTPLLIEALIQFQTSRM